MGMVQNVVAPPLFEMLQPYIPSFSVILIFSQPFSPAAFLFEKMFIFLPVLTSLITGKQIIRLELIKVVQLIVDHCYPNDLTC